MHIGVDFDNTIVCYDALFHRVARERDLIPADLPVNKSDVRNHLRRIGKEEVWTEMQGYVYGGRMAEAAPYPGVLDFFLACRRAGIRVSIISHKTRHPFLGEQYDLHQAALKWLEQQGFFDPARIGLPRASAFFELTKQAKLERIAREGCTHFIDDLPELLAEPSFPKIERILFDPNDLYATEISFFRAQTWPQIWDKTGCAAGILSFAKACGFQGECTVVPVAGGGNNRVYHLHGEGKQAILKQYFRHAADARDRFGAERAFYDYLWQQGIRRTPEPLGWDAVQRLGLFSFVDGRKLAPAEIDSGSVNQASDFILELNRRRPGTETMPSASEACFSVVEHLECIGRRVARLEKIEVTSEIEREAASFIRDELRPAWKTILERCPGSNEVLPPPHRILSPSDFGFHNALLPSDGRLRFLDFEYAGWDDPAKLICDFFCQPQVPVELKFWPQFVTALSRGLQLDAEMPQRASLLLPAYQLKWCCIMLNEFGRADRDRRDFAKGASTAEERKSAQLAKARARILTLLETS